MRLLSPVKIKYADKAFVKKHSPLFVHEIINSTPIVGGRKRVLFDYKVQNLKVGTTTCVSGWHRDTIFDDRAVHHLFIIGSHATEFKKDDGYFSIDTEKWFTYTNEEHRGPSVKYDCQRILIRATETDLIMPRNSKVK